MMQGRKLRGLRDVVEAQLCIGCGACAAYCEKGVLKLVNDEREGIHPVFEDGCGDCRECLTFCPGAVLYFDKLREANTAKYHPLLGPWLGIYEGYAEDPEIRYRGSSGGAITALSLYFLEHEKKAFVLHTGMDAEKPWQNRAVMSSNRYELLEHAGSRYAPSSPCAALRDIAQNSLSCVFVGKPCDVAAVHALSASWPELHKRLGFVLSFFCAGPPPSGATRALVASQGILPESVTSIRYRGHGWPGDFQVQYDGGRASRSLTYREAWGRLASYRRSLRCNLCPDGTGEFADIACGDAWHRYDQDGNPGLSVLIVRTPRGQEILKRAVKAGYLVVEASSPERILSGQGLQKRRMELHGRLLALRFLCWPSPEYPGFDSAALWRDIPFLRKMRILFGTVRRILVRRYNNRCAL